MYRTILACGVAALTLLPAGPLPAAAQGQRKPAQAEKPTEASVEAHRLRAARHATARQWDLALREIGLARTDAAALAQQASRDELRTRRRPDPRYRKEMAELQEWFRGQTELARKDKKVDLGAKLQEFRTRQAALKKKYGLDQEADAARLARVQATRARHALTLASLDDTAARYHSARGDAESAANLRRAAAASRVTALHTLKRTAEATQAAEKLLQLAGSDPNAYRTAAQYFQRSKQYGRAVQVWQRALQLLDSGKARIATARGASPAAEVAQRRAEAHRQLAFCYQRLGKPADMRQSMQRAAEIERSLSGGAPR